MPGNDFPKLGIDTQFLRNAVEALLVEAREGGQQFGAVNWGDLRVVDIEYRLSMLTPDEGPHCIVIVEEAAPECGLPSWLNEKLKNWFPHTYVECAW